MKKLDSIEEITIDSVKDLNKIESIFLYIIENMTAGIMAEYLRVIRKECINNKDYEYNALELFIENTLDGEMNEVRASLAQCFEKINKEIKFCFPNEAKRDV